MTDHVKVWSVDPAGADAVTRNPERLAPVATLAPPDPVKVHVFEDKVAVFHPEGEAQAVSVITDEVTVTLFTESEAVLAVLSRVKLKLLFVEERNTPPAGFETEALGLRAAKAGSA